jgi:hypothetical protein
MFDRARSKDVLFGGLRGTMAVNGVKPIQTRQHHVPRPAIEASTSARP